MIIFLEGERVPMTNHPEMNVLKFERIWKCLIEVSHSEPNQTSKLGFFWK